MSEQASRERAIACAENYFDRGGLRDDLARRVAFPTESQNSARAAVLRDYLQMEIKPSFEALGFTCHIYKHASLYFLLAKRLEDPSRPTVLGYGHGDVVRGLEDGWDNGLSPWRLTEHSGRWYGRGTSDNKGQHSINLGALNAVLVTRGTLGFNAKYLIEVNEETGSPGLRELVTANRDAFEADVLIASDGPRLSPDRPTIFLGARGCITFDLTIDARATGHHSGNWGGLLSEPAIQLAHAIASIAGPTGQIHILDWVPRQIPDDIRRALADCEVISDGEPKIDPEWGEPGLSLAEKVFAWSSFTVLAFEAGTPKSPVSAIPPKAWARCQLRFVVGVDVGNVLQALRQHLHQRGFGNVIVSEPVDEIFYATSLNPDHPWVSWAIHSVMRTTGKKPAILPSLGGSLPNDVFSEILALPTIWVPHSYLGSCVHGVNEHLPLALAREALGIMAGLYWDLGEENARLKG